MAVVQLCNICKRRTAKAWVNLTRRGYHNVISTVVKAACDDCGEGFEVVERITL